MDASTGYGLNFTALLPYLSSFRHGLWITCILSVLTVLISFALAVPGVALRLSPHSPVRLVIRIYVDAMRNTPTLVLLFLLYFGLASSGWKLSPFTAALIALVAHSTAFVIEIYRGGIQGISPGQREAAAALDLGPVDTWRHVILPQALRISFPALGNQVVGVVLGTSLIMVISGQDVTFAAYAAGSDTFRYFEAFLLAALIYFVIVQVINGVWRLLGHLLLPRYGI